MIVYFMVIDWIAGAEQFRPNTFGKKDDIGIIKAKAAKLVGPDLARDTGASFFELDEGSLAYFNEVDQTVEPDSHVTFVPFYKVLSTFYLITLCILRVLRGFVRI